MKTIKSDSKTWFNGVKICVHPGGRLGNQLYFAAAAQRVRMHLREQGVDSRIYWYATTDYLSEIQKVVDFEVFSFKRLRLLSILYRGKVPLNKRPAIVKLAFKIIWSRYPFRKYVLPDEDFDAHLFDSRKYKNIFIVNYHQNYNLCSVAITDWQKRSNGFRNQEISFITRQINEVKPVGVTMRFGDFLDLEVAKEQGNLSHEYFSKAFKKFGIIPGCSIREIWIFSDDPELGLQTLEDWGYGNIVKVRSFGLDHIAELLLLSNFANLIICNSTYSWWAGYLVSNGSRVIAPSPLTRNLQSGPARDPRWEPVPANYPNYEHL